MNNIVNLVRLLRPKEWLKNVFVFTGIIFGGSIYNEPLFLAVVLTAISFCLASSSIYIINDMTDIENDRAHPTKCLRPLPSGQVTFPVSLSLSIFCMIGAFFFAWNISYTVFGIVFIYILMNIAYSLRLKQVVLLDVFCIAAGFMLRILGGTVGVGIPPSKWLLFCGLFMTLFLGFAKRRAELSKLKEAKGNYREVLNNYDSGLLDTMTAICCSGVIIGYSLYTMSAETVRLHGTENLIYTVPFVIYAMFRYLYLMHRWGQGGDPTKDLIRDKHILTSVCAWIILTAFILTS